MIKKVILIKGIGNIAATEPAACSMYDLLQKLGEVHKVTLDGNAFGAVLLSEEKLNAFLKKPIAEILKAANCATNYSVKNSLIMNTNLYQQRAILSAIVAKLPEGSKDSLGLFNLQGSKRVHRVLNAAGVREKKDIWWFWTGEQYFIGRGESDHASPWIIPLNELGDITNKVNYLTRFIDLDYWYDAQPLFRNEYGAFILGGSL